MEDLCNYVLKGRNKIRELNLSHCNINNYSLSIFLRNIKHLKSLKRLKINLNYMNSESLLALGSALNHYTGKH